MARKNDSLQKAVMREMMCDYLKNNDISIKNGKDMSAVMHDMMSVLLEGALDEDLDEDLGYPKYDYRNKDTENSRNSCTNGRNRAERTGIIPRQMGWQISQDI